MLGFWFGLATATFTLVAYIGNGVEGSLIVFGVACCFAVMKEVVDS